MLDYFLFFTIFTIVFSYKFPKTTWYCPNCRFGGDENSVPDLYYCFCKKEIDPSPDLYTGTAPHACQSSCGLFLILIGIIGTVVLTFTPVKINNVSFDVHTMLYCVLMVILGVQTVSFSIITGAYARIVKLYPINDNFLERFFTLQFEKGVVTGIVLFLTGIIISVVGVLAWMKTGFGSLLPASMLRLLLPAVLTLSIGWQIIFTSFLIGIFQIKTKYRN